MKNIIEILSPGENCWKTKKIISKMKKLLVSYNVDVEFVIISELEKMLTYETWILPTIIINGKIVARGYKPSDKEILQNLKR